MLACRAELWKGGAKIGLHSQNSESEAGKVGPTVSCTSLPEFGMAHQPQIFIRHFFRLYFFLCKRSCLKAGAACCPGFCSHSWQNVYGLPFTIYHFLQFIYQNHCNFDDHFKYFISVENVVACFREFVYKKKRDSKLHNSTPVL